MAIEKPSKQLKDKSFNKFKKVYYSDKNYFKMDHLPYWISSYSNKLNLEFTGRLPSYYPTFNQGNVVMIDFGVNIGSEMSGGHFGIVLNKKDDKYSRTITVVPLTSKLHDQHVSLGKNIVEKTKKLIDGKLEEASNSIQELTSNIQLVISYENDKQNILEKTFPQNKKFVSEKIKYFGNQLPKNQDIEKDNVIKPYVEYLEKLINSISEIKNAEDDTNLSKLYLMLSRELLIIKKMETDASSLREKVDGLEKLSAQLGKYNNESFAAVSNVTTISKLRVRKFSEYNISGNVSISDMFMDKIKIGISNYMDL